MFQVYEAKSIWYLLSLHRYISVYSFCFWSSERTNEQTNEHVSDICNNKKKPAKIAEKEKISGKSGNGRGKNDHESLMFFNEFIRTLLDLLFGYDSLAVIALWSLDVRQCFGLLLIVECKSKRDTDIKKQSRWINSSIKPKRFRSKTAALHCRTDSIQFISIPTPWRLLYFSAEIIDIHKFGVCFFSLDIAEFCFWFFVLRRPPHTQFTPNTYRIPIVQILTTHRYYIMDSRLSDWNSTIVDFWTKIETVEKSINRLTRFFLFVWRLFYL